MLMLAALACSSQESDLEAKKSVTSGIELSDDNITIVEGQGVLLTATVKPWNASETSVTWSSADEDIAIVSETGRVTAVSVGETDITARAASVSAVCHVTVSSSRIPAESLAISGNSSFSIKIGRSVNMSADILPENATDAVEWSTADPQILEVDSETGAIKGLSAGMTTVTASVNGMSASVIVLVHGDLWIEQTDALVKPVSLQDFDFAYDTIRVARGEVATFQGLVYADANQYVVTPSVTRFALEGQDGIAVTPKIYWLKDINCSDHWDSGLGGRPSDAYPYEQNMIPDPLMPPEDLSVSIWESDRYSLWVEFTIPEDLPAGLYTATVNVSGTDSGSLDFPVQVYDVNVPEDLSTDLIQWMNCEKFSLMNNGVETDMYSNYETFAPIIVNLLNDYGQNSWQLMYTDMRSHCAYPGAEYDEATGKYKMKYTFNDTYWKRDFEFFDKYCTHLHQIHGKNIIGARFHDSGTFLIPAYEINDDGGVKVDENGNTNLTYVSFPTTDSHQIEMSKTVLRDYFAQLVEYLKSNHLKDGRSWFDVYVQTVADEPDDVYAAAYNQVAGILKECVPELKILEPILTSKIDPNGANVS